MISLISFVWSLDPIKDFKVSVILMNLEDFIASVLMIEYLLLGMCMVNVGHLVTNIFKSS